MIPLTKTGAARNSYQSFVQDEIKVSPRLTINLGVRYDLSIAPALLYNGGVVDTTTGKIIFSDVNKTGQPNAMIVVMK